MITSQDLFLVALLVFLEGILSVDNALVLAILAKRVPPELRKKALTYGLFGAFAFRIAALFLVVYLVKWHWMKYVGGGYLLYIAVKHLFFDHADKEEGISAAKPAASFWKTVVVIELTDIAFALDSILAAVALTSKMWVIITGGILGIVMMRFAASMFIHLLERFPQLERTAYMLVLLIGSKVILEAMTLPGVDFHSPRETAFWVFWGLMAAAVASGFLSHRKTDKKLKL